MFAEIRSENTFSKKVCSETSFQKGKRSKKNLEKHNEFFSPLRFLSQKYSKSLNDLTWHVSDEVFSFQRIDLLTSPRTKNYESCSISSINGIVKSNKVAGRCVLSLLMLNTWRHQKIEHLAAQKKIKHLSDKIEGFEMQVYVLRQLLNAEKKRLAAANDLNHNLQQIIENCNKEKNKIIKDNENLEKKFSKMEEYCSQIENALRNQENDIITSKLEAENWEKQLEKEREKIKKIEKEELFLKEKLHVNDKVLVLKTQQVEELTRVNKELQEKLDVQIPLWDETMAQVDLANAKLKESERIKNELEKILEKKENEIIELKSMIESLKKKLQEEDEKIGLLGKSLIEKSEELSLIQKKVLELSKISHPWSGGLIKVASICASIPVACIFTVGSLLLPFPPSYKL